VLDLVRGRAKPALAVVSTEEKAEVARVCGADEVLRIQDDWSRAARAITGEGVDVVVDPVGGERFTDSLRALDVGGRLMVVGFAEGAIPQVKVNRLLLRNLSVLGVALDPWEKRFPGYAPQLVTALEEAAAEGRVHPHVGHRLPFNRADEALGILDRRQALGKVVVEVKP
jgi:NADPH:quinone reductase